MNRLRPYQTAVIVQSHRTQHSLSADPFGRDIAEKVGEWLEYRGTDDEPTPQSDPGKCESAPTPGVVLKSAAAATFKMHALDWLWPERFALGKLGLIVGLPDEGKGQVLAFMAAVVT